MRNYDEIWQNDLIPDSHHKRASFKEQNKITMTSIWLQSWTNRAQYYEAKWVMRTTQ